METIIVKNKEVKLDKNGKKMALLEINGNRKVSVGSWLEQEVNFVEHDVQIGDNFQGEIVQKGDYLNLVGIDFGSLKKGADTGSNEVKMPAPIMAEPSKDKSIVAQMIVKEANNRVNTMAECGTIISDEHYGEALVQYATELAGAYRFALDQL